MDTYNKNGFMYSFYKSTESFLSNIDNPNYDTNKITEIKNVINQQKNDGIPKENIILIQLESLFDPLKLNHVELSKDPLENFHKLMDRYTHGEIIVPVIGGGTTQTEFEILTGIDTKKLFTKMPYLNLLNHNPVESIANIFKNYGYSTTAIHNYFSSFYNRVRAYENLGFDTFIPLETISDRNKNENFWYKDDLMINEIKNRILSTNEKDFIFGVTVEAHGPYNTEINGDIKVKSDVLDDKEKNELQNYVNIINNTDKFISNLIDTLNEIGEDYILIMYSDHLPSLGYQHSTFNKTLDIDDLFKTPYLIITSDENKRMDMENTLYSYEFIGSVLNYLNLDSTIYHKFRHYFSNNENSIEYENQLLMDIKYKNIYDDSLFPYKIQKIQIGNSLPEINNIVIENNIIYIIGENFTPNSKVFVNKDLKDSEYISENYIKLNGYVLKINDTINLVTFSNKNSPLNSSKSFEFLG